MVGKETVCGRRRRGLRGARWQGERLEKRWFVGGGGEGFADLGAVHVALRRERGEVWRVVVEAGCAQGAAPAHLSAERAKLHFLSGSADLQFLSQMTHLLLQGGHSLPFSLLLLKFLLGCCKFPVMLCPSLQPGPQLLPLHLEPLHLLLQGPLLHLQHLRPLVCILEAPLVDFKHLLLPLKNLHHLGIHAGSLLDGCLTASNIYFPLALFHLFLLLLQTSPQRGQSILTCLNFSASLNQISLCPCRFLLCRGKTSSQLILLGNLCPDLRHSEVLAPHSGGNHGLAVLQPAQQARFLLQQSLPGALLGGEHGRQAVLCP